MRGRVLLVLSLLDQRADIPRPYERITSRMLHAGLSAICPTFPASRSTVSRMTDPEGSLFWAPVYVLALAQWARDAFGVEVDPGWIMFGTETSVAGPLVPLDCHLRYGADASDARQSNQTYMTIRAAERRKRGQ